MFSVSVLGRLCRYQYLPSLLSPGSTTVKSQQRRRQCETHVCCVLCALSPVTTTQTSRHLSGEIYLYFPLWLIFSFLITLCVVLNKQVYNAVRCLLSSVRCVFCAVGTDSVRGPGYISNTQHTDLDWTSRKYFWLLPAMLPVQYQIKRGIISSVRLPWHGVLSVLSHRQLASLVSMASK